MTVDSMFLKAAERPDVPRHPRWGGPMIIPEGGGKPVYYQRISGHGKVLDDESGLMKWKARMTAIGLSRRSDLMSLVATTRPDDKDTLNRIVDDALDAAQAAASANRGTALHAATEHVDLGGDLADLPADMHADIAAYQQATARLEMLAMEQFVVVDELKLGGSFDRLVRCPDGKVRIGDLKTGESADVFVQATAIQMACYAHGRLYDPKTGERFPLTGVDLDTALMFHLPQGSGTCTVYEIDIATGWQMALVAHGVKAWRKRKDIATPVTY